VSGRHRSGGTLDRRIPGDSGRRLPIALGAVVALVAVTAVTLRIVAANASGCAGELELRIAATPEIAPAVEDVARKWTGTEPQVSGKCVSVTVTATAAATVASSLTVYAGSAIDVAAVPQPTPEADQLPSAWLPDSTAWLRRVQVVDRSAFEENARSIATSPVVVAMPEAAARLVGWPAARLDIAAVKPMLTAGGPLKFGIAEPRRETTGLAAAMLLGESVATSDADLPALVKAFRSVVKAPSTADLLGGVGPNLNAAPSSEQAVLAHNGTNPPVKLVAVQVDPVAPQLDYPFAIRSGLPRDTASAAHLFQTALLGESDPFARRAFRAPDGRIGNGFPLTAATRSEPFIGTPIDDGAAVLRALGLWTAANSPSRTLALFDVTSSMGTVIRTANGNATRTQVMAAAAAGGLDLFTSESRVGMWAFASGHQEVLPIEDLTTETRQLFDQRLAGARPSPVARSELYATLLAAYKVMKDGYDQSRPNIIVVITDGGDSQPGGLRREKFSQDLQRLADPTRPIRVVLIGIGVAAADAADLQAIAEIVGGGFFPLTSPEQIQTIFLKALLRVGAA
jgi:Ca-activated chloride channel homolog